MEKKNLEQGENEKFNVNSTECNCLHFTNYFGIAVRVWDEKIPVLHCNVVIIWWFVMKFIVDVADTFEIIISCKGFF